MCLFVSGKKIRHLEIRTYMTPIFALGAEMLRLEVASVIPDILDEKKRLVCEEHR